MSSPYLYLYVYLYLYLYLYPYVYRCHHQYLSLVVEAIEWKQVDKIAGGLN